MATLAQKRNTPKKVFSFRWHGFNRKGQKVSGEFQADSINTVKAELRKQGVNVTKVSKQGQGLFSKGGARIKPGHGNTLKPHHAEASTTNPASSTTQTGATK